MTIGNLQVRVALNGIAEAEAGLKALRQTLIATQQSASISSGAGKAMTDLTESMGKVTAAAIGFGTAMIGIEVGARAIQSVISFAEQAIESFGQAKALQLTAARLMGREAGQAFYQGMLEIQKQSIIDAQSLNRFAISAVANKVSQEQALRLAAGMQDIFAAGGMLDSRQIGLAMWQLTEMIDEGTITMRHLRSLLRPAPGLLKMIEEEGGFKSLKDFTGSNAIPASQFLTILERIANRSDVKGVAGQLQDEIPELAWQKFINEWKVSLIEVGSVLSQSIVPSIKDFTAILKDPEVQLQIKSFGQAIGIMFDIISKVLEGLAFFISETLNRFPEMLLHPIETIHNIRADFERWSKPNSYQASSGRPITNADRVKGWAGASAEAMKGA